MDVITTEMIGSEDTIELWDSDLMETLYKIEQGLQLDKKERDLIKSNDIKSTAFANDSEPMTSLASFVYISRRSQNDYHSYNVEYEKDQRISLAYERLQTIPKSLTESFGKTLHTLDISHNLIEDLSFLKYFSCLTSLIADNNLISSESSFPPLPTLKLLWLNHCKISNMIVWIRKLLSTCPKLQHLSLMGNPGVPSYLTGGTYSEYQQYRLFVISLFPYLVHLDDHPVTGKSIEEAKWQHPSSFFLRVLPTLCTEYTPSKLYSILYGNQDLYQIANSNKNNPI